jgi:hypothetical protein
MTFKDYARLATQVFEDNTEYHDEEGRHMFVTLADIAIQRCDSWSVYCYHVEELQGLLRCMEVATHVSADNGIANCGYYGDLPWIASFTQAACSNAGLYNCLPLPLLRALEDSLKEGLLTGEGLQQQLMQLISRSACRESVTVASLQLVTAELPLHEIPPASLRYANPNVGTPVPHSANDVSYRTPLLETPSAETLSESDIKEYSEEDPQHRGWRSRIEALHAHQWVG